MAILLADEAERLIASVGPRLGYDFTYPPKFVEGRRDAAVVEHSTENGSTYGFTTIYLVWKNPRDEIRYRALLDSRDSRDYLFSEEARVADQNLLVKVRSGGRMSGYRTLKIPLTGLDL